MSNHLVAKAVTLCICLFGSDSALAQEAATVAQPQRQQPTSTYDKDLASKPLEFFDDPAAVPPALLRRASAPTVVTRGPYVSVQVNVAGGGGNVIGDAANEPSIAVDPTDPNKMAIGWRHFSTITSNFRQAGLAYTQDGGQSWTFPGVLDPGQFRSDPVLASDLDGVFHYSSLSSLSSIEFFTSFDGGVTWTAPVPAFGGDKQWIAVARTCGLGKGHIYQIWNVQFTCCPGPPGPNKDFTRSADTGASFDGPYAVTTPSMKWGTMDVGADGTLYLAGATLNGAGHLFTKSTDAKDPLLPPTFDVPTSINLGGTIGLGSTPNPQGLLGQVWIATDQSGGPTHDNIYVLNSVDPPGTDPLDVMFTRSEDGGSTWSTPVRVNDDPTNNGAWQWFGTMSVAPNGRIDVVFNDTRNSGSAIISELFYTYSMDAGVTWTANIPVSPSFNSTLGWPQQNKLGDYYDMISDSSGAHVAYAATFSGEQDVYFLHIPADCNINGVDDAADISSGTSLDCNGNGVPDECDIIDRTVGNCASDCNGNAIPDACDIAGGTSGDCNENTIPDSCDIADGTSLDVDLDGVPDECACVVSSPPVAELTEDAGGVMVVARKNRYLSFHAGDSSREQAIRVTLVDLPPPFDAWNGVQMWVGTPIALCELPGLAQECQPSSVEPGLWVAPMQCDPLYFVWSDLSGFCANGRCSGSLNAGASCVSDVDCADAILHVYGEAIVPSRLLSTSGPMGDAASYTIEVIDRTCDVALPASYSPALPLTTAGWADLTVLSGGGFRAPDDAITIADITGAVQKFSAAPDAPGKTSVDLVGVVSGPDPVVDFKITTFEFVFVIDAFIGGTYPFPPGAVPCSRANDAE